MRAPSMPWNMEFQVKGQYTFLFMYTGTGTVFRKCYEVRTTYILSGDMISADMLMIHFIIGHVCSRWHTSRWCLISADTFCLTSRLLFVHTVFFSFFLVPFSGFPLTMMSADIPLPLWGLRESLFSRNFWMQRFPTIIFDLFLTKFWITCSSFAGRFRFASNIFVEFLKLKLVHNGDPRKT